jgi:hypothetical protein
MINFFLQKIIVFLCDRKLKNWTVFLIIVDFNLVKYSNTHFYLYFIISIIDFGISRYLYEYYLFE